MAGWILNSRAASAAVLSPLVTMRLTSACCCGDSFGRRPPMRPSRRADSNPAFALSRSMARSSSATVRSSVAHEDVDVHVDKTGQQRDIAEINYGGGRWGACRIDGLNHAAGDDQDSGRNDATASHVEHTLGAQYGGLCGSSGK